MMYCNLLKNLENQTFSRFIITIIDQSDNFNKQFYENFNLRIDLVRQKIPSLWKARNNAVRNTTEEVIAFLDDDSIIKRLVNETFKLFKIFQFRNICWCIFIKIRSQNTI